MSASETLLGRRAETGPRVGLRTAFTSTPLRRALLVTACWRAVILLWGIACHGLVQKGPDGRYTLMNMGWARNPLTFAVDAGVRQDAFWYGRIAQHGYTFSTQHLSSIVFYPLFPLLVKGLSFLTGSVYTAGMLIPTASLFVAVYYLQLWLQDRGMGGAGVRTVALLTCFPFGFFWASMYTESLFLVLVLATFVSFERGRWGFSSVYAFAAVLCRPTGLILVPSLGLLWLASHDGARLFLARKLRFLPDAVTQRRWVGKDVHGEAAATADPQATTRDYAHSTHQTSGGVHLRSRAWLPILSGPAAFVLFCVYQWIQFGTPFASVRAEAVAPFSRSFSQAISDLMLRRHGFPPWFLLFMLAFGLAFLGAVPLVWRRFGPAYALFAALAVLFPMTSGLTSLERYVMIDFPVFAAVGTMANRRIPIVLTVLGFYAMLGFMTLFVAGYTII